jgi:hypothetical protein
MNWTKGDTMFTMCAFWFINNGKTIFQKKSVDWTQCNASCTPITSIFINMENMILYPSHDVAKA